MDILSYVSAMLKDAPTKSEEEDDKVWIQRARRIMDLGTNDGNTVLHVAALKKMIRLAKFALQDTSSNEMVNSINNDGQTPLQLACTNGDREMAKLLLDNGADINAADRLGLTPLHRAIIAQGKLEDETDEEDGTTEETSVVGLLLSERADKKLDIHSKTFHQGATPLHLAAIWALPEVVKLLINNGADKHSTTWRGETVLHWAFRTMRADEKQHPERMIPYISGAHAGDAFHYDYDEDMAATGSPKIARYGAAMISALVSRDKHERRKELLRIAYREEDESMVRYSARRLLPNARNSIGELIKLWLAMRPEKFGRLETELLRGTMGEVPHQNVLGLAARCGNYEVVKWLLKSKRWSKEEKRDAKGLVPIDDHSPEWETLWDIPFLQDNRRGDADYRYPLANEDNSFATKFQSSIVNFYNNGRYTHFLHHSCNVRGLLYNGERGPVRIMEDRGEAFKNAFPELNTDIYNESHLRFRWIHLPVNCMEWMKVATSISYQDKGYNIDYFTATHQFLQQSWHELPETNHKNKYMNPTCLRKEMPRGEASQLLHLVDRASDHLALYTPYITFARPTDKTKDMEKDLLRAEDGKTHIIHRSKTLDTYHLGTTDDEKARDQDSQQVVFRHAQRIISYAEKSSRRIEVRDDEIPVLHIGQLWLWVIDEDTIVTSESHSSHENYIPIFENILNYLNDNKEQLGRDIVPSSLDGFVRFITSFYINTPFNFSIAPIPRISDKKESIHDMFLSSIEMVNDKEHDLRAKFKKEMHEQDDGKKIDKDKTLHGSVTETVELLSEIKDIQQELNIISSVIRIQKNVWDQLTNRPRESDKPDSASQDGESVNWGRGTEPAQYVLRRIGDLRGFAEETQRNVESILDLKMNQLSLLQAEEAGRQGTTLMVFTTVTVVFTPLSFLSALFALNVSIFPHSGNDVLYQPGWLFGILFGVTIGFIAIVLAIILTVRHRQKPKKRGGNPPKGPPGYMKAPLKELPLKLDAIRYRGSPV